MTKTETKKILSMLKGGYPRQVITPEMIEAWTVAFTHRDLGAAIRRAKQHIRRSKFFPSITEVLPPPRVEYVMTPEHAAKQRVVDERDAIFAAEMEQARRDCATKRNKDAREGREVEGGEEAHAERLRRLRADSATASAARLPLPEES